EGYPGGEARGLSGTGGHVSRDFRITSCLVSVSLGLLASTSASRASQSPAANVESTHVSFRSSLFESHVRAAASTEPRTRFFVGVIQAQDPKTCEGQEQQRWCRQNYRIVETFLSRPFRTELDLFASETSAPSRRLILVVAAELPDQPGVYGATYMA